MTAVVRGGQELTAEFLTSALSSELGGTAVSAVQVTPVGTGQVSDSYRLSLTYDGPAGLPPTMIAKVPAADAASRNAARAFRTYEIEANFYIQLAPRLPVALARCYYAAYDPGPDEYVVLLEDLTPALPGDQLAGLHPDDAAAAIRELAALHAAGWDAAELAALPWLNRSDADGAATLAAFLADLYPRFRERYADRLEPGTLSLIEDFLPQAGTYLKASAEPRTIVHGDFRADNLLFGATRPVVLDWQTAGFGAGTSDLSYFLASSLPVAARRQYEEALVRRYHAALNSAGAELSWHDCWTGYRRHAFGGIVMDIIAGTMVKQTERGDAMFATMARRHARHALDLDARALL
jgi:aminoglycoside phosphotransferase (APT) family kinase protein